MKTELSSPADAQALAEVRAEIAALTGQNAAMRAILLDIATIKAKTNAEANVKTIWAIGKKQRPLLRNPAVGRLSDA